MKFPAWLQLIRPVLLLTLLAGCRHLPEPVHTKEITHLPQGWTPAQRQAYYHTAQGTEILPYDWFLALETPNGQERFVSNDNVSRYRLQVDHDKRNNPDGLPVGVVKDINPETHQAWFGLTCAACHNGQINYKGTGIRIVGGEGTLDLTFFIKDMFKALAVTGLAPSKFDRFAERVLGPNPSQQARTQLHRELKQEIRNSFEVAHQAWQKNLYPTDDGFGRQDALGHGGNNGFGKIGIDKNLTVANGPVSYPAVWNALNWDWVQYNGSIRQPMGRNVGEVLGVGSHVSLKGPKDELYKSTVKVRNLYTIETMLHSLKAPHWPEAILGQIDTAKAHHGAVLFQQHCAGCHNPSKDAAGDYKIKLIPLEHIGTDPRQATNLKNHMVDTGDLGLGTISAGEALQHITESVAQRKYRELGIGTAEQAQMNRGKQNLWRAPLAYRAHSLDGIWATPPYLHNGSVPSLYELLSPVPERSKTFYTGNLEFDPVHVGYRKEPFDGGFRFNTSETGNSNAGHEFTDRKGKGVIGPKLTPDERMALVEYLKTRQYASEDGKKAPYYSQR